MLNRWLVSFKILQKNIHSLFKKQYLVNCLLDIQVEKIRKSWMFLFYSDALFDQTKDFIVQDTVIKFRQQVNT